MPKGTSLNSRDTWVHKFPKDHILVPTPKLLLSSIVMASVLCAFATNKPTKNEEVTFTARSELVLVPVLVTDRSGAHVSGLKKEDFTVYEDGAPRQIATFEEITSNNQRLVRPSNPREFSNALGGSASEQRITLIVLDFLNTPFLDQQRGRQELLKYLMESVDEREPTGLLVLTSSGLQVIHDFTTDPLVLVGALHRVASDAGTKWKMSEELQAKAAADDLAQVGRQNDIQSEVDKLEIIAARGELNLQRFQERLAITITLQAMQQVAQAMRGFSGRKALIWVSGGFPFDINEKFNIAGGDADLNDSYERTFQLLEDAQVAIYPVDDKGLQANSADAAVAHLGAGPGDNVRAGNWARMDTEATFQTFATATGGRAYFNSNDLVKGFRDAVRDSSQYYLLGYYLDHTNAKPAWRKLAVKVKQKHVEVRSRSGFFVTNATVNPANSRDADMAAALYSPLDCTALKLVARWETTEPVKQPGKKRVVYLLDLAADPSVVDLTDNNHLRLDFLAIAISPEGKAVGQPEGKVVDLHLTSETLAELREKGLSYRGSVELSPGQYNVRIVVRDSLTGKMGSVSAPLTVH